MRTGARSPAAGPVQGLGPTRARVLRALQDSGGAATAAEVAGRLDVHRNTARFHLDALVAAGLVERTREEHRRPGRPQTHYRPTRLAPVATHRSYGLLAEILTRHLAEISPDPRGEGLRAGRSYGRLVAAGLVTEARGEDAVPTVLARLDEMGFESTGERPARPDTVEVTNCPFLEVAEASAGIVCAVHQGLMDGMLAGVGSSVRVDRLDPFVAPGRCVAHLRHGPAGERATHPGSGSR